MSTRISRYFRIQNCRRNEKLLQKQFQFVAFVDIIHEDQTFALHNKSQHNHNINNHSNNTSSNKTAIMNQTI